MNAAPKKRVAVQLGARVRDTVTGFEGTVTGLAEYLHESATARVTAQTGTDEAKERWIAEARLEPVRDEPAAGFHP